MNAKQRKAIRDVFVSAGKMGAELNKVIKQMDDLTWEQISDMDATLMEDVVRVIRRLKTISNEVIQND